MSLIRALSAAFSDFRNTFVHSLDRSRRAKLAAQLKRARDERDLLAGTHLRYVDDLAWSVLDDLFNDDALDLDIAEFQFSRVQRRLRLKRFDRSAQEEGPELKNLQDLDEGPSAEEVTDQEPEAEAREQANALYWGIRRFLLSDGQLRADLEDALTQEQRLELARLRDLFLRGAWSVLDLPRERWEACGIHSPGQAQELHELGVDPGERFTRPLVAEEVEVLTASFGSFSSRDLPELLRERGQQALHAVVRIYDRRVANDPGEGDMEIQDEVEDAS